MRLKSHINLSKEKTIDRNIRRYKLQILRVSPVVDSVMFDVLLVRSGSGLRGGAYRNGRTVRVTKEGLDALIIVRRLRLHPDFKDMRKAVA